MTGVCTPTLSQPAIPRIKPKAHDLNRFYWLDWLRFTAAFMVVACHARGGNWVEWGRLEAASRTKAAFAFFILTRTGFEWVVVFFVLSGFLVGGKILERTGIGTFDPRAYAIDRVSRIWLPLVPALILSAVVTYLLGSPFSMLEFCGNLLGLQGIICSSLGGNYPLWSLAYEVWFYALGGFAAVVLDNRFQRRAAAYIGVALSLAVFTRLNSAFLFCWLLGALSYSLLRAPRRWSVSISGLLVAVAGCILSQLGSETVSIENGGIKQRVPSTNIAIMIMTVGLALMLPVLSQLSPRSAALGALEKLGGRLAAFSYTLYLTHYPLLTLWTHLFPERYGALNPASLVSFLGKMAVCLLAAWLLYLPFERKTPDVRRWLRARFALSHVG